MTTRVYYQGNLSDPISVKLFDADTGKQLDDVAEVQVTVSGSKQPMVDLRRINSTALERCELVAPPPHPMRGRRVSYITLTIKDQPHAHRRMYRSTVQDFDVRANGELEPLPGVYESAKWVDGQALLLSNDPAALESIHAADAMREALTGAIIEPILKHAGVQVPAIVFPAPPMKAPRKSTCPECNGTGEVLLFSGPSPCSQGCKKP